MEEEKVTEPVVETKTEENNFTQEDVNNIVAKETKKAVEKLLKEIGVEDVKSAKEGLKKFKEIQDAQKSDYDKALEMEEIMEEEKVTEPVVETTKTEGNTFTQEDVNNLVAKESKKTVEKLLKDLGVEDVKSAKEGLKKFKEIQDAQKSDYDKALEKIELLEKENNEYKAENNEYKAEKKSREDIDSIKSILKEKQIDEKYAKTIKKLMTDEISEESVMATIEEELPMLLDVETVKIGTEKKENKPNSSINDYLDKKYKDNPFYKRH